MHEDMLSPWRDECDWDQCPWLSSGYDALLDSERLGFDPHFRQRTFSDRVTYSTHCYSNYRPQWSCGQSNIFTPVCHSVHRGVLPQCMLGYPPEQTPPRGPDQPPRTRCPKAQPPGADTPPRVDPPGTRPPGPDPPWSRHPLGNRLQHTVYERSVSILLECILVWDYIFVQSVGNQMSCFHRIVSGWDLYDLINVMS